jgi:hypothetical protein
MMVATAITVEVLDASEANPATSAPTKPKPAEVPVAQSTANESALDNA